MPAIAATRTQPHRFVPDDFDATRAAAVTHLYGRLEERDISTRQALEDFILDWEEVDAVITEHYAAAYVDMTSDTTNPDYKDLYLQIVQEVVPVAEQKGFELKQKLLTSPALDQLGEEYEVFLRNIRAEVEIFQEENVPLFTEERKLDQQYEEISGGEHGEFGGQVYP